MILHDAGTTHDRPTLLLPLKAFVAQCDIEDIVDSVWKAFGPFGSFLCSAVNLSTKNPMVRYDPLCMCAANETAKRVSDVLNEMSWNSISVNWRPGMTLVIDNWKTLHGRGAANIDDSHTRFLQRLLVFDKNELPLFPDVLAT